MTQHRTGHVTESALKSETTAKPDAHMLLVLQLLFQVS